MSLEKRSFEEWDLYFRQKDMMSYKLGKSILKGNFFVEKIIKDTNRNYVAIIKVDNNKYILKEIRSEVVITQRKIQTFFKKGEALSTLSNSIDAIEEGIVEVVKPYVAMIKRKFFIQKSYIVLEYIEGEKIKTLEDIDKIMEVMKKVYKKGRYHGDFNTSNFIKNINGDIVILDTQMKKESFSNFKQSYDILTLKEDILTKELGYNIEKKIKLDKLKVGYIIAYLIKRFKRMKIIHEFRKFKKKNREMEILVGGDFRVQEKIFLKFKEWLLYGLGLSFFINSNITRILLSIVIVCILVDIFYFKEKIDCGNKNLKNLILGFIAVGVLWNFCADFNYRAARAFLKINRDFILVFYLYMIYKYKKIALRNFFISLSVGVVLFFIKTIKIIYTIGLENVGNYRLNSYMNDISDTALLLSILVCFFLGQVLYEKNSIKIRALCVVGFVLSLFFMLLTLTRTAFISTIVGVFVILLLNKKIKFIILIGISLVVFSYTALNAHQFNRIRENIFNTRIEESNGSNGVRILLWKNAFWRIQQHPIMGSGTKQDDKLFLEYVKNMPENTSVEKRFKDTIGKNFNDAHSMYLNGFADNGLFFIYYLAILICICPYVLYKNKNYRYRLSLMGSFFVIITYGLFWSVWRVGWSCLFVWLLIAMVCCGYEEKEC